MASLVHAGEIPLPRIPYVLLDDIAILIISPLLFNTVYHDQLYLTTLQCIFYDDVDKKVDDGVAKYISHLQNS